MGVGKKRSVYFNDEDWGSVKAKAEEMSLSIGKYVILAHRELVKASFPAESIPQATETTARIVEPPKVLKTKEDVAQAFIDTARRNPGKELLQYPKSRSIDPGGTGKKAKTR